MKFLHSAKGDYSHGVQNPQSAIYNPRSMLPLPVANILHHKLGSALSALGVAIGVCMLVTLSGLSRGSLEEVAHRWTGVDADLIVYPARLGDNISTASGGGLTGRDVRLVAGLTAGG